MMSICATSAVCVCWSEDILLRCQQVFRAQNAYHSEQAIEHPFSIIPFESCAISLKLSRPFDIAFVSRWLLPFSINIGIAAIKNTELYSFHFPTLKVIFCNINTRKHIELVFHFLLSNLSLSLSLSPERIGFGLVSVCWMVRCRNVGIGPNDFHTSWRVCAKRRERKILDDGWLVMLFRYYTAYGFWSDVFVTATVTTQYSSASPTCTLFDLTTQYYYCFYFYTVHEQTHTHKY